MCLYNIEEEGRDNLERLFLGLNLCSWCPLNYFDDSDVDHDDCDRVDV